MRNKNSRIVWFLAILFAFFFLVDPFRLFERSDLPQMRVNSELEEEMTALVASAPPAEDYITGLFDQHQIVLLGETGYVSNQLDLLVDLIPELNDAGIYHLGLQYGNASDQARIDELITGTSFDEALAESIMFDHMVILGYEEHKNVFRAAWEVNRSKAEGETPFRIIGLSEMPDYSKIVVQEDAENPEILAEIFAGGIPDEIMYETVVRELVEPGHRALVYTQLEHAFTTFEQVVFTDRMGTQGFPGVRRMGNQLDDLLGNRVTTVVFHTPLQDSRSRIGYGYPVGGVVDRLYDSIPESQTTVGFDIAGSPYADAPVTSDVLTDEDRETELELQEFADGYIMVSRIVDYEPVNAIPGFISDENIARARRDFPGADPGEVTAAEMNEFVAGTASTMTRIFEAFE